MKAGTNIIPRKVNRDMNKIGGVSLADTSLISSFSGYIDDLRIFSRSIIEREINSIFCHPSCKTCSGPDANQCIECN